MSPIDPPFRADHVGSLLRPPEVLGRSDAMRRPARSPGAELRAVEDAAIAAAVAQDGEPRDAQHHRRRVPPGVVPPRLPRSSSTASPSPATSPPAPTRRRTVHMTPPKLSVVGPAAPRPRHPGRRLPVPGVGGDQDTEGLDPVADDGALPRRPGRHRHRRLPRPRGVLRRPGGLLPGRDRRAVRRRVPVRAARRHQPRVPVRPGHARRRRRARRRPRRAAARLRRADQRLHRRPARRPDGRHPPVPRQLPQHVVRRGRLRAGGRGAVQRARRRRLLPRVRRRALRRLRPAALRAQRTRRSCSAWSPASGPSSSRSTSSPRASTRPRTTCRWSSCASARSAASPARSRATR